MDGYHIALILASLPAIGYVIGGLLAETVDITQRTLSLSLHAAAGVVLSMVAVELLPEALKADPTFAWVIIIAFMLGGAFFVAMDRALKFARERISGQNTASRPLAIFFGVAIELMNDGIMVGAGSTISTALGLILALGQIPANIPEAFATIATFKGHGISYNYRVLLSCMFIVPILLGTTLGYFAVRGQPVLVKQLILAFTAGVLTTLVVEEIVPEAHRDSEAQIAALVFVLGFTLFTLISTYIG